MLNPPLTALERRVVNAAIEWDNGYACENTLAMAVCALKIARRPSTARRLPHADPITPPEMVGVDAAIEWARGVSNSQHDKTSTARPRRVDSIAELRQALIDSGWADPQSCATVEDLFDALPEVGE